MPPSTRRVLRAPRTRIPLIADLFTPRHGYFDACWVVVGTDPRVAQRFVAFAERRVTGPRVNPQNLWCGSFVVIRLHQMAVEGVLDAVDLQSGDYGYARRIHDR